ncbi:MAG TPA: hypothetical protein VKM35_00725 [Arenimonas sp.]|uniref:hypothetical protein n=1 Tax=Arenimonas sp. TaxID=1872635 RepID=UPI002B50F872|nr:hypothetical protein [Arenimonas sp.]HMB55713.1 hypothetical protein [Arenimonas sp.]
MKRFVLLVASSLLATAALAADPVATLTFDGSVMVNQGKEFVAAHSGQALMPGDRVMVAEQGSATVTFNDGCALSVEPGSLVSVPSISTCAGGSVHPQKIAPKNTSAVGATGSGGVDWVGAMEIALPTFAVIAWDLDHHRDDKPEPTVSP